MTSLSQMTDWLSWIIDRVQAHLGAPFSLRTHVGIAIVLAISIGLEIAGRRNWRIRYGSRNFRIDVLYYIFYYCGLYHLLIFAWLYKLLVVFVVAFAPWLQMNLLGSMHPVLQVITMIIVFDFIGYWSHRWRHSNSFLWAFHSVHHSQTVLTPMTNYRFHFVDETLLRLWIFIPFQILGQGIEMWLVVHFIINWILLLQHSEWNWTYGRFGWVFVSPAFHRIHHSKDERQHNANYAMLFSFWDDLFGTAERKAPPPAEHGIAGDPVPETFWGQLLYPFREIARTRRPAPSEAPAAPPSPS